MNKPNITTELVAETIGLLLDEMDKGPMTAAEIANRLGLAGNRETKRRKVRAIIRYLREEDGEMIVATLQGGYWLTRDEKLWRAYQEGRQIDAKKVLAVSHKQKKMLADRQGQGLLFVPKRTCGVASQALISVLLGSKKQKEAVTDDTNA